MLSPLQSEGWKEGFFPVPICICLFPWRGRGRCQHLHLCAVYTAVTSIVTLPPAEARSGEICTFIQYDTDASRYYIISSFLLLLVVMFTSVLVLLTYKFEVNIWNAKLRNFLLSNNCIASVTRQCRYTDSAHMQWCHTATGAGPSVRVSPIMSHSSPFLHLLSLSPASSHLTIRRVLQFYLNIWIRRY